MLQAGMPQVSYQPPQMPQASYQPPQMSYQAPQAPQVSYQPPQMPQPAIPQPAVPAKPPANNMVLIAIGILLAFLAGGIIVYLLVRPKG
jgi:hypothetical protein